MVWLRAILGLLIILHVIRDSESAANEQDNVVLALSTTTAFNCTAKDALALQWIFLINGRRFDINISGIVMAEIEDLRSDLLRRNLTVTARKEHDDLILECRVVNLQRNFETRKEIHITIQGFLSSPGNVRTVNGSSSIFLSWTAPFTLDITDVDPDISHYTVYITNINTGRMGEENVTETEFNFTGLPGEGTPVPCHTYQITVSAWNVVGEGNRSEPVYGRFITIPGFREGTTLGVIVSKTDRELLQTSCTFQANDCLAMFYTAQVQGTYYTYTSSVHFDTSQLTRTEGGRLTFTIIDLPHDDHYTITLLAENDNQTTISTTFSTFDVQNANVLKNGSSISITCYFTEGSWARGCLVEFVPNSGSCAQNMNISVLRMGNERQITKTVMLPNGSYTVRVYDIDHERNGGNSSQHPAITWTEPILVEEPSAECTTEEPSQRDTELTNPTQFGKQKNKQAVTIGAIMFGVFIAVAFVFIAAIIIIIIIKRKYKALSAYIPCVTTTVNHAQENDYVESHPVGSVSQQSDGDLPPSLSTSSYEFLGRAQDAGSNYLDVMIHGTNQRKPLCQEVDVPYALIFHKEQDDHEAEL